MNRPRRKMPGVCRMSVDGQMLQRVDTRSKRLNDSAFINNDNDKKVPNDLKNNECRYDNRSDLYRATEEKKFDLATEICMNRPEEAKLWVVRKGIDDELILRRLPLHVACIFRSPHELIASLVDAHPEGVRSFDQWGNLPIHYVCEKGCSSRKTIQLLLETYPESSDIKGMRNLIPLSLLEKASPPDKDIMIMEFHDFLVQEISSQCGEDVQDGIDKKGIGVVDERHYNDRPDLYKAIETKQFELASEICMKRPGEARLWVVRKGIDDDVVLRRLPLHLACIFRSPHELIASLLDAHPEAAKSFDQWGNLPIHYACEKGCLSGETIKLLLGSYPESLNVKGMRGLIPLSLVEKASPPNKDIIMLEFRNFLVREISSQCGADNVDAKFKNGDRNIIEHDGETQSNKPRLSVTEKDLSKLSLGAESSESSETNIELALRGRVSLLECELANASAENAVLRDVVKSLLKKLSKAENLIMGLNNDI